MEDIKPNSEEKFLGTGEEETPLAIPEEITIRTMESDLKSLPETGGLAQPLEKRKAASVDQITAPSEPLTPAAPAPSQKTFLSKKIILVLIITLVVALVIAAVVYFLIFPLIFSSTKLPAPSAGPASPTSSSPSVSLPATSSLPSITTTHSSLFKQPPQILNVKSSELLNLEDWFKQATSSILVEVVPLPTVFATSSLTFSSYVKNLQWPTDLAELFEDNFTLFVYRDKQGNLWPGFIGQLKPTITVANFQKKYTALLESLIKQQPGYYFWQGSEFGQPQNWRSSKMGTIPIRSLTFNKAEVSINYAFVAKKLIISSSNSGLKEALKRL